MNRMKSDIHAGILFIIPKWNHWMNLINYFYQMPVMVSIMDVKITALENI